VLSVSSLQRTHRLDGISPFVFGCHVRPHNDRFALSWCTTTCFYSNIGGGGAGAPVAPGAVLPPVAPVVPGATLPLVAPVVPGAMPPRSKP